MNHIGWFILVYFVFGWIVDILLTLTMVIVAAVKDAKASKKAGKNVDDIDAVHENIDAIHDTFDQAKELGEERFSKDKRVNDFVDFMMARLLWPITVPTGLAILIQNMKEKDR